MNNSFWNNFREKFIYQFLYETGAKSKNEAIKLFNWLKKQIPYSTDTYIKEGTQRYVLGFLFSKDLERVVLIRKLKPAWQAGCLNGVGGKVETIDKSFQHAMSREFKEETGVLIEPENWKYFAEMLDYEGNFYVSCYKFIGDVDAVKTMEKEEVAVYNVDDISWLKTISNLKWLIPLALDGEITCSTYYNENNTST